jgi:hypothetical protein
MADQHSTMTTGREIGLTASVIEQLKGQLRGELLCPGDTHYDSTAATGCQALRCVTAA